MMQPLCRRQSNRDHDTDRLVWSRLLRAPAPRRGHDRFCRRPPINTGTRIRQTLQDTTRPRLRHPRSDGTRLWKLARTFYEQARFCSGVDRGRNAGAADGCVDAGHSCGRSRRTRSGALQRNTPRSTQAGSLAWLPDEERIRSAGGRRHGRLADVALHEIRVGSRRRRLGPCARGSRLED